MKSRFSISKNFLGKIKTLFLISSFLFLFFLSLNKVHADTLYANQVAYSPTFYMDLEDDNGHKLNLKTNSSLSDGNLWQASGVEVSDFSFISKQFDDTGSEATYELNSSGDKYGNYSVTGFRFLSGSKISLIEYDTSIFDKDDKIELLLRTTGVKNVLTVNKLDTEIDPNDPDLDYEEESFLDNFNIDLKLAVDLKNETTTKTVQAEISGNKNGFVFKTGLEETIQEALGREDAEDIEDIPAEESALSPDRDVPTIGFSKSATGLKKPQAGQIKGISEQRNLEVFIVSLTNWLLSFVAAIAVIMLIYGGYLWITDQGDESGVEKSKKIILGSVVGILLIISAYTIVNTIIRLETNLADGCEAGFEIGNGTDIDLNCDISEASGTAIGAGVGGVVGNIVGGQIGEQVGGESGGDTGGLIGGLLGGAVGAITGGGNWGKFFP